MKFWRKTGLFMLILTFLCSAGVAWGASLKLEDSSIWDSNVGTISGDQTIGYTINAYYYGDSRPPINVILKTSGTGYTNSTLAVSSDLDATIEFYETPPTPYLGDFAGDIRLIIPGNADIDDAFLIAVSDDETPAQNFATVSLKITPVQVTPSSLTLLDETGAVISGSSNTLEFVRGVGNSGMSVVLSADELPSGARLHLALTNGLVLKRGATEISENADLWTLLPPTAGVTYGGFTRNLTGSPFTLKIQAPNPGPNTTKAAENFTISAPYLQVTDGGAYVAGWDDFTWPSFKVAVVEDKITLNPTDVYATVGVEVPIDTKIDAEFNSAVLTIGEYRELNSSVQSIPWNGLILSSDKRVVTITGTPKSPGNGHFRVFAKSRVDAVVIASADFTVHVTDTANFTLYPSDNIELDPDQPADEEVKVRTTMTLSKLTITPPGGSKTDSIGNWHGLTISVKNDNDNPRVIIIGAPPLEEGTGNFTITGSSSTGEERSATLTITIKTPDAPTPPDIPKLTLSPSTLNPIVGKEFDKDVAITVPSGLSVSNITVNGQGAVEWHGLTIVVDTNGRNINVFGTPNEEGTKNFDVAAQALDPIASAILTITVHPQTEEGRTRGKFMDVDGEIQVERGKSTPIELRSLSYITVDSVTEVNPDGKWEWIQGSSLEGVKEFYVSVHPTVTGLYTLRINYSLGGTAYYENVNYRSIRTDEEDLASSGCSMSAGSVTLAALAVLYLCLMRKKV